MTGIQSRRNSNLPLYRDGLRPDRHELMATQFTCFPPNVFARTDQFRCNLNKRRMITAQFIYIARSPPPAVGPHITVATVCATYNSLCGSGTTAAIIGVTEQRTCMPHLLWAIHLIFAVTRHQHPAILTPPERLLDDGGRFRLRSYRPCLRRY